MPASGAAILLNAERVFTALLTWFVFHENFVRRIAIGVALVVVGALVLSWPENASVGKLPLGWGHGNDDLMVLVSALYITLILPAAQGGRCRFEISKVDSTGKGQSRVSAMAAAMTQSSFANKKHTYILQ